MKLTELIKCLDSKSEGERIAKEWGETHELRAITVELPVGLLFTLVARQMAFAGDQTMRMHVQYRSSGLFDLLRRLSVPGLVRDGGAQITNQRGICYIMDILGLDREDQMERFASTFFVTCPDKLAACVQRSGAEPQLDEKRKNELVEFGRAMQVIGAALHAALDHQAIRMDDQQAAAMMPLLVEQQRSVFGHAVARPRRVLNLAREYAVWEAAAQALESEEVAEEIVCGVEQ